MRRLYKWLEYRLPREMKNTLLILILFTFYSESIAQLDNRDERFTIGVLTGFPDRDTHNDVYDYGFAIGVHVELQTEFNMYFKARTYYFPNLNNLPYFDVDGGVGFNLRTKNDVHRFFIGGIGGFIRRDNAWHPKVGLEVGYEIYVYEGFYIGVVLDTQYKHDDKVWRHKESGHNVKSVNLVLGYSWYFRN